MERELIEWWLKDRDSETWHDRAWDILVKFEKSSIGLRVLEFLIHGGKRFRSPRLNINLAGIDFENPAMVAAGWDKKGEAVKALYTMGASSVEVGSVLEYPQSGNSKPRQWVVGPGVVINRLGFNSPGMEVVAGNLQRYQNDEFPIGISLGKNKEVPDYDAPRAHAAVVKRLLNDGDYFTLNVSSPNTPGLRALQDKEPLRENIQAVSEVLNSGAVRSPLFVKIAPDLTFGQIDDVIEVCLDEKVAALVVGNTTINPEIKAKYGTNWATEEGGLSGNDENYRQMILKRINYVYLNCGNNLPVVGVGGINNVVNAARAIEAGARLLQINTAIRSEGPRVFYKINRGLDRYLRALGMADVDTLVGTGPKLY